MAKTRAAAAAGREKAPKVSVDKVKKAKRETKPKRVAKEESEEPESSEDEAVEAQKTADKESESSSEAESDATADSSSDPDEVEATSKKSKKVAPPQVEPNALFTIDTKPTKVAPAPTPAADTTSSDKKKEKKTTEAKGGMNRKVRRRLQLIDRQREALRKSMKVDPSDEKNAELEAELNKWIEELDGKAALREKKKSDRKTRTQERLSKKKAKVVKGGKPKAGKKGSDKAEKEE